MPNTLKIILTICLLIFLVHVIRSIKKSKINVRNAIVWLLMDIATIISIWTIPLLEIIAKFTGIKTVSNLLFFLGFIFLIFVVFDLAKIISTLNKKIVNLTQEVAILKKEVTDDTKEQKRNNKSH